MRPPRTLHYAPMAHLGRCPHTNMASFITDDISAVTCQACIEAAAKHTAATLRGYSDTEYELRCPTCHGLGVVAGGDCTVCSGTGQV